jgi:hypothetical protein
MFLTLSEFLSHFPVVEISKSDFIKNFRVMYSKSLTLEEIFSLDPLCGGRKKALIKDPSKDIRYLRQDEVAEYFYEIVIRNSHKYLTLFYQSYFQFKDPETLKWDGVELLSTNDKLEYPVISLQKNDASRRIIRNLFYMELLDLTKVTNTVKSKVSFWKSLVNMYTHLELEDRFFAPSSVDLFLKEKKTKKNSVSINYNNLFYLFQAYQPKASIFNPYSINWILKNVIKSPKSGGKIFSPVLSWCSYLVAYMHHPGYDHYVGVDVMKSVCDKAEFLGSWYQKKSRKFRNKKVDIINRPSQELGNDFIKTNRNYFDTVIICPPYYDMEIYHEGEQSIDTYPDYDSWLDGYFRATVEICAQVLKPGGTFAMIANDYYSLKGEFYPLTEDLSSVASEYFTTGKTYYLQNRTSPLRVNSKKRTERLFLFHK